MLRFYSSPLGANQPLAKDRNGSFQLEEGTRPPEWFLGDDQHPACADPLSLMLLLSSSL